MRILGVVTLATPELLRHVSVCSLRGVWAFTKHFRKPLSGLTLTWHSPLCAMHTAHMHMYACSSSSIGADLVRSPLEAF